MVFCGKLEDSQTIGLPGHIFLDPGDWTHPILQSGYNLRCLCINTNTDGYIMC